MPKVWGTVVMSERYHLSPDCYNIKENRRPRLHTPCFTVEYKDEQSAFDVGHIRLCDICSRSKIVDDKDLGVIQLTVEQVDTLRAIRKIYAETKKPITLKQIAAVRKRAVTSCHRIVNVLALKGLLLKRISASGKRAMKGSIIPTAASARVLAKLAIP